MNIKKIKKQTLVLILLFVIVILLVIASPFMYIYFKNQQYERTDLSKDYINKNFVSYNGGTEAEVFFNEFVVDNKYIDISFKYRDNDNAIRLYDTSRTIFVLDIMYEADEYPCLFNNIYYKTNQPDVNDISNYKGDFLMTAITEGDSVYLENYCGIFFNKKSSIIRYVFINNVNSIDAIKSRSVLEYITRSINISWTFN